MNWLKSRYMHEDMDGYAEQIAFDEQLECTGILDQFTTHPTREILEAALEEKRMEISGLQLVRSTRIPPLDQSCGLNLKFRQLIECGETQARLQLSNIPLNPDTYNALYDLCNLILDPVIDYFGAINLTYGFSSPALAAKIDGRIWDMREQLPSLDDELSRLANELNAAEVQATQLTKLARELLTPHWPEVASLSVQAMLDVLNGQSQEPELQRLTQLRRELNDAVSQSQRVDSTAFVRSVNGNAPDATGNATVPIDLSSRLAKAGDTMTGSLYMANGAVIYSSQSGAADNARNTGYRLNDGQDIGEMGRSNQYYDDLAGNCNGILPTGNCAGNAYFKPTNTSWWTWGLGFNYCANSGQYDGVGGTTYAYNAVPSIAWNYDGYYLAQDEIGGGEYHRWYRACNCNCNCGSYTNCNCGNTAFNCRTNCNCNCNCNCSTDC